MRSEHFQRVSWKAPATTVIALASVAALTAMVWSSVDRSQSAFAGPPNQSALSIQQRAQADDPKKVLDAGRQRDELVGEIRALRQEVAELKSLMTSGRMRANIGNFADMPLDRIQLEIDYDRLREAMRAQ